MEPMPKSELQTLDNEMLIEWLNALSRYRAEDIGMHIDTHGHLLFGEIRPTLEDVQDELVRRGLDSRPQFVLEGSRRPDGNLNSYP